MISSATIEKLLAEDVAGGDLTTEALGIGERPGVMTFTARGEMVLAGADVARRMMSALSVVAHAGDGDRLAAGALVLTARGTAGALHAAWKASQTLIEVLSGIATETRELCDIAARANVRVATTRKTMPGMRRLSHLAVKAGGGILHRQGLAETILVFAEHRAFLPGVSLADLAGMLRARQPEKMPALEASTVVEAIEAAQAGFGVVQLEKFPPADVAAVTAAVRALGLPTVVAAAGGINRANIEAYLAAGAGLIVTSAPYSAPPRDIAVRIERD